MRIDYIEYANPKQVAKAHNREGVCDSSKCKAACCKFVVINSERRKAAVEYFKNFGFKQENIAGKSYLILEKNCKYLNLKTSKCKIYKRRPIPCRHFPVPTDLVYLKVAHCCTYKFKTEKQEIKKTPENL